MKDLTSANLSRAKLVATNFHRANLSNADLAGADLTRAILYRANLSGANLVEAMLEAADFAAADLTGANLSRASLTEAKLTAADLFRARLDGAHVGWTTFGEVDLSTVQGLDTVRHLAPSSIDEAIHLYDKLLLILSKHSLGSRWVQKEVETAFEKEAKEHRVVLFPIRIDDAILQSDAGWAADIRRMRHIGDFRQWKDRNTFQQVFNRLLHDLKATDADREAKAARTT
jgi:hypothetical protein